MHTATYQSIIYPLNVPFNYGYLIHLLTTDGYKYPRNKIASDIEKGYILKLRKGLYCASPKIGGNVRTPIIANVLYSPSYISFQYALAHWSLIPEQSKIITSATPNRSKLCQTPLGDFVYQHINQNAFPYGLINKKIEGSGYWIASPEKAIADSISQIKFITKVNDIPEVLFDELRIDETSFFGLGKQQLIDYANLYRSPSNKVFSRYIQKLNDFCN